LVTVTVPEPADRALKVTLMRFDWVEKGVGLPPPKVIVPAELEKVGSVVQSENAEPSLLTLTTEKTLGSNFNDASTALTFAPPGETLITEVKV